MNLKSIIYSLAASSVLASGPHAYAQTTYTANSTIPDPVNVSGGVVLDGVNGKITTASVFQGTGDLATTNSGNLTNPIVVLQGDLNFTGNLTLGAQTAFYGANSSFTGNVYVNAYGVTAVTDNAFGNASNTIYLNSPYLKTGVGTSTSTVTLGQNIVIQTNNARFSPATSGYLSTYNGNISAGGNYTSFVGSEYNTDNRSVRFNGVISDGVYDANFQFTGANSTFTLANANTYSGTTTVGSGSNVGAVLQLENNLAIQNSALVTTGSGKLSLGAGITTPTIGGLSGGSGDLASIITNYNTVSAITLNPNAGSVTYFGVISDGAVGMTLTKSGAGTQVLRGNNTYTGSTTITGGELSINAITCLGADPSSFNQGQITINGGTLRATANIALGNRGITIGASGGTIINTGTLPVSTTLAGSGRLTKDGSGQMTLSANNSSFTGGITVIAGSLSLGSSGNASLGANPGSFAQNYLILDGSTATLTNAATGIASLGNRGITLGAGGGTLQTQANNRPLTVDTGIVGSGQLRINSSNSTSSAVTLSGSNSYTGGTAVSAGGLFINGNSGAANGAVTVAAGAILGGNGTLGGAITVNGMISPGANATAGVVGTFSTINDVTWNANVGSNWKFDLGSGGTSDKLAITGNFTKGTGSSGAFVFDFNGASSGQIGTTYTLATWTGTTNFSASDFAGTNLGSVGGGVFALAGNSLTFTAVPEPSTWGVVLITFLGIAVLIRRRQHQF